MLFFFFFFKNFIAIFSFQITLLNIWCAQRLRRRRRKKEELVCTVVNIKWFFTKSNETETDFYRMVFVVVGETLTLIPNENEAYIEIWKMNARPCLDVNNVNLTSRKIFEKWRLMVARKWCRIRLDFSWNQCSWLDGGFFPSRHRQKAQNQIRVQVENAVAYIPWILFFFLFFCVVHHDLHVHFIYSGVCWKKSQFPC